jgi:hypothetical protein
MTMTDGTSAGGSGAGAAGTQSFPLRPSTSVADILTTLQRHGISDLEALVSKVLDQVREHTDEDDDSPNPETDFFISEHYVLIRETVPE